MNQTPPSNRTSGAKKLLSLGLAASLASTSFGQNSDPDALRRLQEENAALRRQLAEAQGRPAPAAAPTPTGGPSSPSPSSPTTSPGTTPPMKMEDGVQALSPFQVNTDKDYGYLRTNSVTATRIGMAIQVTPVSVSILSKDFIDDANIRSVTDVLRYSSSGAGDNNFAMRRPANSATPQGGFTLRGFGVNNLLRDGLTRYLGFNVNNVDRIEVVKGPASVFFGSGYPGGVINYITKQPVFGKIPTTVAYSRGDNNVNRVVLDHNIQLSDKTAMRLIGSYENSGGERAFEYNKTNSFTANMTVVPFQNGKLRITGEIETYDARLNSSQGDWIYPTGWFQAYSNPSAELIGAAGSADATAYRTRIFASPGNWIADVRNATKDFGLPLYTKAITGAYYTDRSGKRIHDEGFNYSNRGSFARQRVDTPSVKVEASPTSWLDFRYVVTHEQGRGDFQEGVVSPNADGVTFNTIAAGATAGYYRTIQNQQFDLVFKLETGKIKHRLLVGGTTSKQMQQFNANDPRSPNYSQIPGSTNPIANPGVTLVNGYYINPTPGAATPGVPYATAGVPVYASAADVPVNQVIRDRNGNIKNVQGVFTNWDPGAEIAPDISRLYLYNRTLLDGYKTLDQGGYANYNATLLNDRLNILAGVRRESHRDSGQSLTANFPWFSPPVYAFADQVTYPPDVYNYGPAYSGGYDQFQRQAGTSYMAGASFEVVKDVNVFASYSKVFRLNLGNAGGIGELDVVNIYNAAQNYGATQGRNTFQYNGATISSLDQFRSALTAQGALSRVANEAGFNAEVGVKTSLWNNKVVGTFSLFRAERRNQRFDDTARQNAEQLNFGNNVNIFGPSGTTYNGTVYGGARVLRWRTVGVRNRIEGADFDFVITPTRNFQSSISGAWMWTAKTLENPTVAAPGTAAYAALTGVAKINADLQYGERIENVPEYRLNSINKYTLNTGVLRGLSLGANARYSSTTIISRSVDYNPRRGGLTSGNFLVFDANVSYPWEVAGFKFNSTFGAYNLTDKTYIEGATTVTSPRRTWLLTNSVKF